MFWLQVIVALGVVLATVLVAAGRGDSLGELSQDRPPARLPEDREVVPADVNQLRLGVGLRGYRMDEVDDVLDTLAEELARRDEEIARLRGAPASPGGPAAPVGSPAPAGSATPVGSAAPSAPAAEPEHG